MLFSGIGGVLIESLLVLHVVAYEDQNFHGLLECDIVNYCNATFINRILRQDAYCMI